MTPAREVLTRRCAWCACTLRPGEGSDLFVRVDGLEEIQRAVSHGICPACEDAIELELEGEDDD